MSLLSGCECQNDFCNLDDWAHANKMTNMWQPFSWNRQPTVKVLTFGARRLKVVSCEGAPADGEDVTRVIAAVVVKGPPPAIEGDQHLDAAQGAHCCRADEVGIFTVHRLQLHAHLEGVLLWCRRLLLGNIEGKKGGSGLAGVSICACVTRKCSKINQILFLAVRPPTSFSEWAVCLYRYLVKDARRCHLSSV